MSIDPRTPVIVGAGQALDRGSGEEPLEPAELIVRALRAAGKDSTIGERLLRAAESVRCVPVIGWRYPDAAALVAEDLGVIPRETVQSAAIGGDGPQVLLNQTAAEIARGQLDIALIGGAEAVASVRAAQVQGRRLGWREQDEARRPTRVLDGDRPGVTDVEAAAGLAPPVNMYALIESALAAESGRSPREHLQRISELWSRLSQVAAANPYAWIKRAYTPEQIATATPENRLVSSPYTKLMTANIHVNMASGLILASARAATAAGVPKDRWVFVHAGARAQEEWHVTHRRSLTRSPAIHAAGRAALHRTGVAVEEVAHIDLYSCFPSAVQIAARELGVGLQDPSRPPTVTGGLTFAGGPGNNYAGHSIATLVSRLRSDPGSYGLTTALGWYLTKHAVGIYSTRPPRQPFANLNPQPPLPAPRSAAARHDGQAIVEACTVAYARDGSPDAAILAALTPGGERVVIRSSDRDLIDAELGDGLAGSQVELAGEAVVHREALGAEAGRAG